MGEPWTLISTINLFLTAWQSVAECGRVISTWDCHVYTSVLRLKLPIQI